MLFEDFETETGCSQRPGMVLFGAFEVQKPLYGVAGLGCVLGFGMLLVEGLGLMGCVA